MIGIIALLVSLLLPALNRARRAASQQVCASNVRQVALAVNEYAADNKGAIVSSGAVALGIETINGVTGNVTDNWSFLQLTPLDGSASIFDFGDSYLGKYLVTVNVLNCPETQNLTITGTSPPTTYALTQLISPLNVATLHISQVSQASRTALVGDSIGFHKTATGSTFLYPNLFQTPENFAPYGYFHARHPNSTGNVGFFDGHVEALPVTYPLGAYSSTALAATAQSIHLGVLIPTPNDAAIQSAASYQAKCLTTYDYYFWTKAYK